MRRVVDANRMTQMDAWWKVFYNGMALLLQNYISHQEPELSPSPVHSFNRWRNTNLERLTDLP